MFGNVSYADIDYSIPFFTWISINLYKVVTGLHGSRKSQNNKKLYNNFKHILDRNEKVNWTKCEDKKVKSFYTYEIREINIIK